MRAFTFVSADDSTGKIKPTDRDLIRSRCMHGVNKRQDSRRSLQAQRQARGSTAHQKTSGRVADAVVPPPSLSLDWEISRHSHRDTLTYPRELRATSRSPCSSPPLHIEPHAHKYTLITAGDLLVHVKSMMYPIYNHVYFEDRPNGSPLISVMHDDLFRNAVQLIVSSFKERMQLRPWGTVTNKHYLSTIALLNHRLSSGMCSQLADTTIWSMTILVSVAIWRSHHAEASTHASALRRLIDIGGGGDYLSLRPTLRYHLFWYAETRPSIRTT